MSAPDASRQHTPGPWHTDGAEIFAADGTWIGETLDIDSPDQGEANASLAAAAPDLLAACQAFLNPEFRSSQVTRLVRDAIAKTEGRDAK